MTSITVATTDSWKDKATGEKKNRPNGIALCSSASWQNLQVST
jgi:hypothetical protein